MRISRRMFLKFTGGTAAAAAAADLMLRNLGDFLEAAEEEERRSPGVETWVTSTCGQCPGGCGILVRVVDGKAVKIEGNPLHPINRGGLCPRGYSGLQVLYNPDRIRGPLKKTGERGSGKWE